MGSVGSTPKSQLRRNPDRRRAPRRPKATPPRVSRSPCARIRRTAPDRAGPARDGSQAPGSHPDAVGDDPVQAEEREEPRHTREEPHEAEGRATRLELGGHQVVHGGLVRQGDLRIEGGHHLPELGADVGDAPLRAHHHVELPVGPGPAAGVEVERAARLVPETHGPHLLDDAGPSTTVRSARSRRGSSTRPRRCDRAAVAPGGSRAGGLPRPCGGARPGARWSRGRRRPRRNGPARSRDRGPPSPWGRRADTSIPGRRPRPGAGRGRRTSIPPPPAGGGRPPRGSVG